MTAHIHHVSVAQATGAVHREAGSQFVTRRVVRSGSHAETDRGVEFFRSEKIGMRPHERTVDQRKGNSRFEHGPRRDRILQQDFGVEMPAVARQRQRPLRMRGKRRRQQQRAAYRPAETAKSPTKPPKSPAETTYRAADPVSGSR